MSTSSTSRCHGGRRVGPTWGSRPMPEHAAMRSFRHRHLLALCLAAMLGACASTPPEATVQIFTAQPRLAAGSTYRYERLPSQAAQPNQAELEATADALLARAGLRRDDATARLAVQLTSFRQDPPPYY